MTIAIDFDGTIVDHRYPSIGKPKPMAFEVLKALINDGHRLILWTNREGSNLQEAVEFCRQNGVEFYAVNSEYPDAGWSGDGTARKIRADLYIDDRNLGGLPDWGDIYAKIAKKALISDSPKAVEHHHHHHKHHHHRNRNTGSIWSRTSGLILELIDRCRNARSNFRI